MIPGHFPIIIVGFLDIIVEFLDISIIPEHYIGVPEHFPIMNEYRAQFDTVCTSTFLMKIHAFQRIVPWADEMIDLVKKKPL